MDLSKQNRKTKFGFKANPTLALTNAINFHKAYVIVRNSFDMITFV